MQALDVIHSKVRPYTLNGSKKVQGSVYAISCILNRSLDTKLQIFDDIQVLWLSRPIHAVNFIVSNWLEFTCAPGEQGHSHLVGKVTSHYEPKVVIKHVTVLYSISITVNFTQSSHSMHPQIITDAFLWCGGHMHSNRYASVEVVTTIFPITMCDSSLNITWFYFISVVQDTVVIFF